MKIGKLLGAFDVSSIAIQGPKRGWASEPEPDREGRDRRSPRPRSFPSMPRLRPVLEGELFDP